MSRTLCNLVTLILISSFAAAQINWDEEVFSFEDSRMLGQQNTQPTLSRKNLFSSTEEPFASIVTEDVTSTTEIVPTNPTTVTLDDKTESTLNETKTTSVDETTTKSAAEAENQTLKKLRLAAIILGAILIILLLCIIILCICR